MGRIHRVMKICPYCNYCKRPLWEDQDYCPHCRARFVTSRSSPIVTAFLIILAIVLGALTAYLMTTQ